MQLLVTLFAAISLCHARPKVGFVGDSRPPFRIIADPYICVWTDAAPGEFPWILTMTQGLSTSCGAVLLSSNYGLTAAHCVDGALPSSLGVWAGLYRRSQTPRDQYTEISSYTMHENYNQGTASYANDIAILTFATPIVIGGDVQVALLPANNNNDYAGLTCEICGLNRTSTLQKASIQVISSAQCEAMMTGVIGANVWENHICVYDSAGQACSCNGVSGLPLHCPDDGTRVAGIDSWGISSGGDCLPSYPSVYTRISAYLGWIASNTP